MRGPSLAPLARADLRAVADLRIRTFAHTHHQDPDDLARYLGSVFLDHPWKDEGLESSVLRDDGQVIGFVGLIPRPFMFRQERVSAAVLSHIMVDPGRRGEGLGRRLLAHFLNGPQDLSWSDVANQATRDLWLSLGGTRARLYGMSWTRPLRPMRASLAQVVIGPASRAFNLAVRPLVLAWDAVVVRSSRSRFHVPRPAGSTVDLDPAHVVHLMDEVSDGIDLRPIYTREGLAWLLGMLKAKPDLGRGEHVLVKDVQGHAVGWLITFQDEAGLCRVIQLAARRGSEALVVQHLLHRAIVHGAEGIEGRMEPRFLEALSDAGCVFSRQDPWVMVASRRSDLLNAVLAGDAFLSRLDGEWWLSA